MLTGWNQLLPRSITAIPVISHLLKCGQSPKKTTTTDCLMFFFFCVLLLLFFGCFFFTWILFLNKKRHQPSTSRPFLRLRQWWTAFHQRHSVVHRQRLSRLLPWMCNKRRHGCNIMFIGLLDKHWGETLFVSSARFYPLSRRCDPNACWRREKGPPPSCHVTTTNSFTQRSINFITDKHKILSASWL